MISLDIKTMKIGMYRVVEINGGTAIIPENDFLVSLDRLKYESFEVKVKYIHTPCTIAELSGLTAAMLESFIKNGEWNRLKRVQAFI